MYAGHDPSFPSIESRRSFNIPWALRAAFLVRLDRNDEAQTAISELNHLDPAFTLETFNWIVIMNSGLRPFVKRALTEALQVAGLA